VMMCGAVFATGLISRGDGSKPGEVTCAWPDDADEIRQQWKHDSHPGVPHKSVDQSLNLNEFRVKRVDFKTLI